MDIRGRSRTLRVNYRTSHQIRTQADRLLGPAVTDVDGNTRGSERHRFRVQRPAAEIRSFDSEDEEIKAVGGWIADRGKERRRCRMSSACSSDPKPNWTAPAAAAKRPAFPSRFSMSTSRLSGHVSISTMHLAKGLEFRAVVVMACDDEIIPLQERIETVGDDADLQEVYDTERHLLYVACTRARDHLLVTGVAPVSEFLDDLK